MNLAIACLSDPVAIRHYVEAAVDLEILLDRTLAGAPTSVLAPVYLPDGYSVAVRGAARHLPAERIGVDKGRLRSRLVESRQQALAVAAWEKLLAPYYEAVIQDLERDPCSPEDSVIDDDGERVSISLYLKQGSALSRRLALRYQLCLQEAGVTSLVVEGKLKLFGTKMRHAWNLAWLEEKVALVDVTLPGIGRPLILLGASPEDVYREALLCDRLYTPSTDSDHCWAVAMSAGRASH